MASVNYDASIPGLLERLQDWCKRECAAEVASGFRLSKTIHSMPVLGVIEFLEGWPPEEQRRLTCAKASAAFGGTIPDADRELIKRLGWAPATGYGPRHNEDTLRWAQGAFRPNKPKLRRALKQALEGVLGPAIKKEEASAWLHIVRSGKWEVQTHVQADGDSMGQFEYMHTLGLEGGHRVVMFPAMWWGLSNARFWDRVETDGIDTAVTAATTLCEWFIDQVPEIVGDL